MIFTANKILLMIMKAVPVALQLNTQKHAKVERLQNNICLTERYNNV